MSDPNLQVASVALRPMDRGKSELRSVFPAVDGLEHFQPQFVHFFCVESRIGGKGLIDLLKSEPDGLFLRFGQFAAANNRRQRFGSFGVIARFQADGDDLYALFNLGFGLFKRLLQRLRRVSFCFLFTACCKEGECACDGRQTNIDHDCE